MWQNGPGIHVSNAVLGRRQLSKMMTMNDDKDAHAGDGDGDAGGDGEGTKTYNKGI